MVKVFFRVVTEVNSVQFRDELETSPEILEKKTFSVVQVLSRAFRMSRAGKIKVFAAVRSHRIFPSFRESPSNKQIRWRAKKYSYLSDSSVIEVNPCA